MRNVVVIAILVGRCASAPAQDEKTPLAWKLDKGQTVRYALRHDTTVTKSGFQTREQLTFEIALEATEKEGVRVKIDRVCIKRGQIDYDSSKGGAPPSDSYGRMIAAQVGKSYHLPMSATGVFGRVTDAEAFAEAVAKEMGGNQEELRQALIKRRGAEQLRHEMQSTFVALTERAVGKGDAWEGSDDWALEAVGKMASRIAYTLKDLRADEAIIAEETALEKKDGPGEVKEGKRSAEIVWDVKSGRMKRLKGTTRLHVVAGGNDIVTDIKFETELLPDK